MVTTSYVDSQAYQEVYEDGHPILVVSASDIATILRRNSIYSNEIDGWLEAVDDMRNEHENLSNTLARLVGY